MKSRQVKIVLASIFGVLIILVAVLYFRTLGRVQVQFDIHQNKEAIYLSTFAEPPQFAIWLENPKTGTCKTVFVTSRVSKGDWEGKKNVPVALPRWYDLFKTQNQSDLSKADKEETLTVTGATPKDDYFSVRVEVPPGSAWNCWIEMNLAGDYNEDFPVFNEQTLEEDEYGCGQPALLYKAEINALEGLVVEPTLVNQSIWVEGNNLIEPVSKGVTTARNVFDHISISVLKPKIKLIEDKIENQ
jgi:hypothetical protein